MSDRWVHVLAVAVFAGASVAVDGPWPLAAAGVAIALAARRPALLCLCAVVLASFLAAGARAAARPLPASVQVSDTARLMSDPSPVGAGLRVDLTIGGRRVEAWAYGTPAARLRERLAGQTVAVSGELDPAPVDAPWLRARGVVARMSVDEVGEWSPGAAHHRIANGLRGLLVDGAASLGRDERALFTGVVFGDDRDQSPVVADDFRAAGLTHLLAVSGQNVAFVLVLCRPLIVRLRVGGRWVAVVGVLALFATVTRFEASVLRATAMAAIAATADLMGREVSPRRVLSLAVAGLVVVRPLLVLSVAFRLSVAATAGIVWLAGPFARRMSWAGFAALPLAVTSSAQLAVAPILATTFGTVSIVSLPANLLAGPAAGAMMTWGLAAGLVAGAAPAAVATGLHLPTRFLAGWLHEVAAGSAGLPVGALGARQVWGLVAAAVVWHLARPRGLRMVAAVIAVSVLALAAVAVPVPRDGSAPLGRDSTIHHAGDVTVVEIGPRTDPEDLAAYLRIHRITTVDLAVVAAGGSVGRDQLDAVAARAEVGTAWARSGHRIPGAVTPGRGTQIDLGAVTVHVDDVEPLRVEVTVEVATGPAPDVVADR